MARVESIEETGNDDVLIEDAEDVELDILTELNASPSDIVWTFTVCRVLGPTKAGLKEPHLFSGDASQIGGLADRLIADGYGSGNYRVRVLKNKRLYRRFDLAVEVPPAKPQNNAAQPARSEIADLIAAIQRSNEQLITRLLERQNAPAPVQVEPVDHLAMMERMSNIFANMRPQNDGNNATALIEVFKSGLETAAKFAGGGEKETSLLDVAKDLAGQILPVVMAQRGNGAAPPANLGGNNGYQPPAPRAPVLQNPNPNPQPPPTNPNADVMQAAAQNIDFLLQQARRNADPGLYAELMLDQLPEPVVLAILGDVQIIDKFIMLRPGVQQFRPWFDRLLATMRELVSSELNPNAATDNDIAKPVSNGNTNS